MKPSVAIVGGGISGLAAAFEFQQRGIPFVLLESTGRCGGVIVTEHVNGYTIDAGPDALLVQKPAAIDLCGEIGLAPRLRPQLCHDTFVVRKRRLCELPEASVLGIPTRWTPFFTTRAFSWSGKLRMAAECLRPGTVPAGDESIASFIGRRFGREAVDYLAEPLLAGIHGGDPARLSMRCAFPRFLDLESRYGSVTLGLRSARAHHPPPSGWRRGPFAALSEGMSGLPDALVARLPAGSIRTGTAVRAIEPSGSGYALALSQGERLRVPMLFLATPPRVTRHLVRNIDLQLEHLSGRIRSASVVTVALGYRRSSVGDPLNGTGVVVPKREGLRIRAVSWVSSKWADRAPADRVLLRAYLGGIQEPDVIEWSDEALIAAACGDARILLKTSGDPELLRIYRWRDATPQLEVGHGDLMERIERRLAERSDLALSAAGFRGTGIADCVKDARLQATRLADVAYSLSA